MPLALSTKITDQFNPDEMNLLVRRVAKLIADTSGNVLAENQFHMVENRLKKRMLDLGISSVSGYEKYLKDNNQMEMIELLGLLTTHHTFFFREFIHFDFLLKKLPELVEQVRARGDKTLRIWSSACSRGQEAYSIGLFLKFHLPKICSDINFTILGTDIDSKSVEVAQNSVYHENEIKEIPANYLGANFIRGKDDIACYFKIKKNITEHCKFQTFNLLSGNFSDLGKFDVVFCRNVLIYFNDADINKAVNSFKNSLYPNGYLVTGLSESLVGRVSSIQSIGPSCYLLEVPTKNKSVQILQPAKNKICKVLCVDDSSSILKILQKVFSKEEGFEVVGTALNGIEAENFLKNNTVDLVTLDIHMPEMDGISYLRKNFRQGKHPPVIMISSVSREDSELAQKALLYGASDFVEKPTLQNMEVKASEIRTKATVSILRGNEKQTLSSFDKELSRSHKIAKPESKLLILLCSLVDRQRVVEILSELQNNPVPVLLLMENDQEANLAVLEKNLSAAKLKFVHQSNSVSNISDLLPSKIYFELFDNFFQNKFDYKAKKILFYTLGAMSKKTQDFIIKNKSHFYWVVEEIPQNSDLSKIADDFIPSTTMPYFVNQYFSKVDK